MKTAIVAVSRSAASWSRLSIKAGKFRFGLHAGGTLGRRTRGQGVVLAELVPRELRSVVGYMPAYVE